MAKLWGILRKNHRIWRDVVVEAEGDSAQDTQEALNELCYKLDIARPIFLNKHEKEVARFGRTSFTQEHFLEPIAFDRLEIEFLRPHGRSSDPRNDFGTGV